MDISQLNEHGGDVYSREIKYDFSANLNPLGMPPRVRAALRDSVGDWEHYPDPKCRKLVSALSEYENIPVGNIVCGNGAADLIYRIIQAVKPHRAVITAPAFSEYEKALKQQGAEVVKYRLFEQNGFAVDGGIVDYPDETVDLLFLCSPNNPTGRTVSPEILQALAEKCLEKNIVFVCDECFMPFVENGDYLSVRNFLNRNVIILKAFTKIYAMAGIRLGYSVFGSMEIAEKVRCVGQCWSVSTPAQVAGTAALQERGFIERTVRLVAKEREFLSQELQSLGYNVFASEANFILFRCGFPLDRLLLKEKIAVRNCCNYDGLGAGYFRIAVRTREENAALVEALRRLTNG